MKLRQKLQKLTDIAKIIGLNEADLHKVIEYLDYDEYGLCFETIITQLDENDLKITAPIYGFMLEIANEMKLDWENYFFIEEMITDIENFSDVKNAKLELLFKK